MNEKGLFFFAGSNLFSKRSQQKTKRILKKSKTKFLFWSAFGRMAFGACSKKSDLVGLVADVSAIPVFLGICLGQAISVLRYQPWKSAENVEPSIYADGKKNTHQQNLNDLRKLRSPKAVVFFLLAYTTSWDKWFVFWISSRSSSFTFELRLSPL